MKKWVLITGLLSSLSLSEAQEVSTAYFDTDVEDKKLMLSIAPAYTMLTIAGASANAFGPNVLVRYAFTKDWAAEAGFHQAFDAAGFGSLFSNINFRGTYAFTGRLNQASEKIKMNGRDIMMASSEGSSGLRGQFVISNYFFQGTATTISLVGVGAALVYEFAPEDSSFSYLGGFQFDMVQNATTSFNPMSAFFGVGMWL